MTRITHLFLLLTIVGPLHMTEQLLTSIEEFYAIRPLVDRYYALFDAAAADSATVLLITIIWTTCSLMLYAVLVGGTARLVLLAVFGLFGAMEAHHVVQAIVNRGYDAGVITCVPYSALGCLMVSAVWQEFKLGRTAAGSTARSFA